MSSLFFVRHGQASFLQEDYDQLSPLGERQSRVLGEHWAALGMQVDRVYVGPKQRHLQTERAVASIYQAKGLPWPVPEPLPELDEHQGFEVMQHVLPNLIITDPVIGELVGATTKFEHLETDIRLKILRRVMRLWLRDKVDASNFESWLAFKIRVQAGLKKMTAANDGGRNVLAFTSGGPVGVTTGSTLKLADEKMLELAWATRNGAYAEFLFSGKRISLITFNSASHFQKLELLTYI